MKRLNELLPNLLLALGISLAGWFIGNAIIHLKDAERVVQVKGLAERDVEANIAIWPIYFLQTASDLPSLYQQLESDKAKIKLFLQDHGFNDDELIVNMPRITDHYAHGVTDQYKPAQRYTAEQSVTLRTNQIAQVRKATTEAGALIKMGVVLSNYPEVQYEFTKLNDIKPEMIAIATQNAREAAQQFAHDSDSTVGTIKSAQQGLFTINNRDSSSPHIKTIRVVTRLNFSLDK